MGQGGRIILINDTTHAWNFVDTSEFYMEAWGNRFPGPIYPGQTVQIYVEWSDNIFINHKRAFGRARYNIAGTSSWFEIVALGNPVRHITVHVNAGGQSTPYHFGWNHNGEHKFYLTGSDNQFSDSPSDRWMQNNISLLGGRKLRDICIPGSHDAGMSVLRNKTAFASEANTLTQGVTIVRQLQFGSRWFDLRPTLYHGTYSTGHYSRIDINDNARTYQGGDGATMDEVINDINNFTSNHQELIILNFSHEFRTDLGNPNYRGFTPSEWEGLFQVLLRLNYLFTAPGLDKRTVDLAAQNLSTFIKPNGAPRSSVIVIVPGEVNIPDRFINAGMYNKGRLDFVDDYADTPNPGTMLNNQYTKMRTRRTPPAKDYFLFSAILTQQGAGTVFGPSIREMSGWAHSALFGTLMATVTSQVYPNVLYIDYVLSPAIGILAMDVNKRAAGTSRLTARSSSVAPTPVIVDKAIGVLPSGDLVAIEEKGDGTIARTSEVPVEDEERKETTVVDTTAKSLASLTVASKSAQPTSTALPSESSPHIIEAVAFPPATKLIPLDDSGAPIPTGPDEPEPLSYLVQAGVPSASGAIIPIDLSGAPLAVSSEQSPSPLLRQTIVYPPELLLAMIDRHWADTSVEQGYPVETATDESSPVKDEELVKPEPEGAVKSEEVEEPNPEASTAQT